MLRTKIASKGKVFAYRDEKGEEIILGNILYLGINDDGSRYYEIPDPSLQENQEIKEEEHDRQD